MCKVFYSFGVQLGNDGFISSNYPLLLTLQEIQASEIVLNYYSENADVPGRRLRSVSVEDTFAPGINSAPWESLWTSTPTQSVCHLQRGRHSKSRRKKTASSQQLPIHSSYTVEPKNARKRLHTKNGANAKLLRLLSNIPRLVRYDTITFLDANLEIILDDAAQHHYEFRSIHYYRLLGAGQRHRQEQEYTLQACLDIANIYI